MLDAYAGSYASVFTSRELAQNQRNSISYIIIEAKFNALGNHNH